MGGGHIIWFHHHVHMSRFLVAACPSGDRPTFANTGFENIIFHFSPVTVGMGIARGSPRAPILIPVPAQLFGTTYCGFFLSRDRLCVMFNRKLLFVCKSNNNVVSLYPLFDTVKPLKNRKLLFVAMNCWHC